MIRSIIRTTCLAGAAAFCLAFSPIARANLVTNGGFETESGTPLLPTGWTVSGTGIASDDTFTHPGNYDIAFTALSSDPSPGTLSQSITTMPGQDYTLSFWLLDQAGVSLGSADAFNVTFGTYSTTVYGSSLTDLQYTNIVLPIAGSYVTGAATSLSFQGLLDPANTLFGNFSFNLDALSLTPAAVPEPPAGALMASGVLMLVLGRRWQARRDRD